MHFSYTELLLICDTSNKIYLMEINNPSACYTYMTLIMISFLCALMHKDIYIFFEWKWFIELSTILTN